MGTGLLEVSGTIDLTQFWPTGESDAMMPKLFRRRSTFGVAVIAKMTEGAFKTYLHEEPGDCFETADFLDQGVHAAKNRLLDEIVSPHGKFLANAKDLVFHEMPSQVKKNGKPVQW
jgi:hypothetical protein